VTAMTRLLAYFHRFRGFDRDLTLLLLSSFVTSIVIGISGVIQPLYLSALGYDAAAVGALLGASALVSVGALLPAGVIADRYGRKRLLIFSLAAYAIAFGIYAVFTTFPALLIASALIGISWGTYVGPSSALLTDKTSTAKRDYVFSLNAFLAAFAIILGSLIGGATDLLRSILRQSPIEAFQTMFWIAVALILIALPALLVIHEAPFPPRQRGVIAFKSWRLLGLFAVVNGFIGFGAGTLIPLLPLYLSSKFLATDLEIGIVVAASNAAMGIASLYAPRLSERLGAVAMITFTQALSLLPLALIPFLPAFSWVAMTYVARTALMNMAAPIFTAYTMSAIPPSERASTSSVITMAWNGAYAVGTMVSGLLMTIHLDFPFYASLLFYALASTVFYIGFRGRRLQHARPSR
jgi:MFS family permease